jgi:hypothetical protein
MNDKLIKYLTSKIPEFIEDSFFNEGVEVQGLKLKATDNSFFNFIFSHEFLVKATKANRKLVADFLTNMEISPVGEWDYYHEKSTESKKD